MKSGNLNFVEPSGPFEACNGTALPLDAQISQIYFWNKTLHVSSSSSVHHQEFFTVRTAMVYVIQVLLTACEQLRSPDRLLVDFFVIVTVFI